MPAPRIPPELGLLLTLGWVLGVWITGGTLLGRWVDSTWNWYPWGTLGGMAAGLAGSTYTLFRVISRLDRRDRK